MNITTSDLVKDISMIRQDPNLIQSRVLDLVQKVSDGKMIVVDPNNPFALGIEMGVTLAVNSLNEMKSLTRKTYPSLADSYSEVYLHMSDYDFANVFSSPSRARFILLLDKEEILSKTVDDPRTPGIKRITIPRYTKIVVEDTTFTLLYPIDIQLVRHGGIIVTYDTTSKNLLQPLKTNLLKWDTITLDRREYLRIAVDLLQVSIDRYIPQINQSGGFSRLYPLQDRFYYCRAFMQNADKKWVEIITTHSEKVYDPNVPTVLLKVVEDGLRVTIPQIYTSNKLITDSVRLDVYTTKGPLTIPLDQVEHTSYKIYWDTIATEKMSVFSAPLMSLTRFTVYSKDTVTGGSNGYDFEKLRDKVIGRSLLTEGLPVTYTQLNNKLSDLGYLLVANLDNITDRQFLATKRLPPPGDRRTSTGISAGVYTLESSIVELETHSKVYKNQVRSTITPGMMYELRNNRLNALDDFSLNELHQLKRRNPEALANLVNNKTFLYSPFHYVIDYDTDRFGCRVYNLNTPSIESKFFVTSNTGLGLTISPTDYKVSVSPDNDGYYIDVLMELSDVALELGHDGIYCQLSYLGKGDNSSRHHINGEFISPIDPVSGKPIDDVYLYRFHLETRYDIDNSDGLIPVPYKSPINLVHEFDVVTCVSDYLPPNINRSEVDGVFDVTKINGYNPDRDYIGVSHEKIKIKLGENLSHLWHRTRTITDYNQYEFHTVNIPERHEKDVLKLDANGLPKTNFNVATNEFSVELLAKKGDIKHDTFGNVIYKHKAGDPVLDDRGEPVIKGGIRGILRHIDLFLLDARYLFVDNEKDIEYRDTIHDMVVDWCVNDMDRINNELLERSEIFYHPIRTTGRIDVLADNNKNVTINAEQKFEVTYWMTAEKHKNATLRDMITKQTITNIQDTLNNVTVSLDMIVDNLRMVLGSQILSVSVKGFCDDRYTTVTLKDNSIGLSIGKRLKAITNNQLQMENDVTVTFVVHGE